MRYRFKNRGISFLEITLYITLIGTFFLFVVPILSTTKRINSSIINYSLKNRNEEVIIEIIESLIREAGGKPGTMCNIYIPHSAQVFDFPEDLNHTPGVTLDEHFFSTISSEGNTLLLKSFKSNGKRVKKHFTLLQFYHSSCLNYLTLYEGIGAKDKIERTHREILLNLVKGKFKQTDAGIFITLKVVDRRGNEKGEFKGYENFSYEIKK